MFMMIVSTLLLIAGVLVLLASCMVTGGLTAISFQISGWALVIVAVLLRLVHAVEKGGRPPA